MISRKRTALGAMLLMLAIGLPLMAQDQKDKGPNLNPTPKSPAELTAFKGVEGAAANPTQVITLSNTFLTTYPDSQLTGYIQRMRMEAFEKMNKSPEAADAGEKALNAENAYLDMKTKEIETPPAKGKKDKNAIDKNSPAYKALVQTTQNDRLYYYQHLVNYALDQQNTAKALEWGQMALKQQPDDLTTLLTLSEALAKHSSTDPKERTEQLKEAEDWGKKGLTLLSARLSSPMAASMPAEQKGTFLASAHDTLGWVYIKTERYPDAQKEATAALATKKDDSTAYYQLGVAYISEKPQKVDEAMEAFAKSVYLGGDTKDLATDGLKQIYQQKNKGNTDGMDAYVQQTGAKLKP